MKIAIKFGDNDFYNCFTGVLKTLLNAYRHTGTLPTDKEQLCEIINQISYGHYLLFQNQFEYNDEGNGKLCSRTYNYLQINSSKILINDEVDKYLVDEEDFRNGETFILDTDLDYPGNDAIYSE
jgi:hypothetical protein